jgi:TRAP-type C4-dicarboxylate transport system substrate-binding protein
MNIITDVQSEDFYSSLPEEIQTIFRNKIKLIYSENDTLFWKSSVNDADKIVLNKYKTELMNQLRITLNCGAIKALQSSEEKIDFFKKAIEIIQPTKVDFSLS